MADIDGVGIPASI